MKKIHPRAEEMLICPKFGRWVIVENIHTTRYRYYTGGIENPGDERLSDRVDHSPIAIWSHDIRCALLYDSVRLATHDANALRHGDIPEGWRGVVGARPMLNENEKLWSSPEDDGCQGIDD